jgi:ubiquinol-cytochrome c reductase subunit 6
MGFFDSWSDLVAAATPWSQVEAEAVSGGSSTEKNPALSDDGGEGDAKVRYSSLDS